MAEPLQIENVTDLPFPRSPIEIVVHNFAASVQHVDLPGGDRMTLLQLFTPQMTVTVKMDAALAELISDELRPSPIVRATMMPR